MVLWTPAGAAPAPVAPGAAVVALDPPRDTCSVIPEEEDPERGGKAGACRGVGRQGSGSGERSGRVRRREEKSRAS